MTKGPGPNWQRAGVMAMAALVLGAGVASCGIVSTVKKVAGAVHGNKVIIDQFTGKLQSGQPSQFQVTYATTGGSSAKITYAVQPPHDLAIAVSQTGSVPTAGDARFLVNSAGQYSCARAAVGGGWACSKVPSNSSSATPGQLLDIYTPAHWVTFLQDFSLAAGFAGDKITSSSMTVNGFPMQCVDFVASGVPGTSKICTTAQHLLGYVQVASQSTGFEISAYSTTPEPALFQVPAGAKITAAKSSTS
jgi:hypothetical protein